MDINRGTGRSTGLMLKAIGEACLSPGQEIEFKDHCKHTNDLAKMWLTNIVWYIRLLDLTMSVRREGSRVFLMSSW